MNLFYVSDNWMDNNSSGVRGGRDLDSWGGQGAGRDLDKWGGANHDADGWSGRGTRPSPWRGNANRRRNDEWEGGSNQKRWRRDENSEWDEQQQKPWKRGSGHEEEERKNNKQGSQWTGSKKDEGNYSKFKNHDNNDEQRPRKPSKWGDKESDNKVKDDRWSRKSEEHTLSSTKDESNMEESSRQTSAPMDLDNYEGESVDNIEQLQHRAEEQETISTIDKDSGQPKEFEKEPNQEKILEHYDSSNFNAETFELGKEEVQQNVNQHHIDECQQYGDYQNDLGNNSQELSHGNTEEVLNNLEIRAHDEYQQDSYGNLNSQSEYEKSHGDGDTPNQQSEPEFNNITYENEKSNYDQSYDKDLSHNTSNNLEHSFINNFESQSDEIASEEKFVGEKHCESQSNYYFRTDCESSINNCAEIEPQNAMAEMEATEADHVQDNDDFHKTDAAESNQI